MRHGDPGFFVRFPRGFKFGFSGIVGYCLGNLSDELILALWISLVRIKTTSKRTKFITIRLIIFCFLILVKNVKLNARFFARPMTLVG